MQTLAWPASLSVVKFLTRWECSSLVFCVDPWIASSMSVVLCSMSKGLIKFCKQRMLSNISDRNQRKFFILTSHISSFKDDSLRLAHDYLAVPSSWYTLHIFCSTIMQHWWQINIIIKCLKSYTESWMHARYPRLKVCFVHLQKVTDSPPACVLYTVINQRHCNNSNINILKPK